VTTKLNSVLATVLAIAASAGGWAQERPTGVKVADKVEVTATVEAVDLAQRLVTVSGPWKDRSVTVRVGSEVPDLDKLAIGDRVAVTHNAAIVAEIKRPGTAARAARRGPSAESGERTVVVVVDSVDPDENTVSFTRDGQMRTAVVEDPDAQAFIKTLRKGDEIELNYFEAFATTLKRVP
jgi:YD repeat-containing protein